MKIGNLNIGVRLGAGFGIVLFMLLGVAALGVSRMAMLQGEIEYLTRAANIESRWPWRRGRTRPRCR